MNPTSKKNSHRLLSMETTHILRDNNQNVTVQANKYVYDVRNFSNKTGKLGICCYKLNETGPAVLQNYENAKHQSFEEPIDLTCEKRKLLVPEAINQTHNSLLFKPISNGATLNNPKKRGRKRKMDQPRGGDAPLPIVEVNLLNDLDTSRYVQDNKKVEVLKAAKSLFSKRTRTLYHWMYPNTPKAQLKAAVATSWEALGTDEKEFYISQVLGRFGFAQSNLMVNPQLEGISGRVPSLMPITLDNEGIRETSSAVSTINNSCQYWPEDIDNSSAGVPNYSQYAKLMNRKCGKRGKLKNKNVKFAKENSNILKDVGDEVTDEFQDDPELSREFQQFKWNLHFNENKS